MYSQAKMKSSELRALVPCDQGLRKKAIWTQLLRMHTMERQRQGDVSEAKQH